MAKDLQKLIMTMGLPQWQGWASVHSANRFKDFSRSLSIVYVSRCHKNTDGGCNLSRCHKNTGHRLNIVDLATHMAKYQPVLTELQVRVKVFDSDMTLDLNTTPDTAGNARGSGENCESQSNLSHIRGGGSESQDGK
jgi:hypothetical protein